MLRSTPVRLALVFALGLCAGLAVAKGPKIDASFFRGQAPEAAAESLLRAALSEAGDGTWERIAVAEVYHRSGDVERAEEILDGITKRDKSDWMRIGRLYYRGGDWEKARAAFDEVLDRAPKDEDWLAEIGMYYNLQGDRETAETLFERSFAEDPRHLYNTLKAAGSYLGVDDR
ncbi:MAG: tetratricopeptide repeat protein [Acidobacteriota bacterium]